MDEKMGKWNLGQVKLFAVKKKPWIVNASKKTQYLKGIIWKKYKMNLEKSAMFFFQKNCISRSLHSINVC
jgi:hypothetical protein